jgi:exodeoxyribonuclease V alpha subunit
LDAIGPSTRLILLGDKDQLASVEAGSVLGDLCQTQARFNVVATDNAQFINSFIDDVALQISGSFMVDSCPHPLNEHITELKRSRRFSSQKGIGKLSKAFILNDKESLSAFMSHPVGDDVTIDPNYSMELFNGFALGYGSYIEEPDIRLALKKLNQQRVLCAVREGLQGMYETNRRIEEVLRINGLIDGRQEFYENRPLMVTQNNKLLGLFNGDVGIVRKDDQGHLKVWFEDAKGVLKAFNPGYLGHIETVFAMTIHKSQGSEFDRVMVILPNQPNLPILTRELVYTAITRAKNKVVIQSGEEVIWAAAERQVERASGLMYRFDEQN